MAVDLDGSHNRLSHSLGTLDIASRFISVIRKQTSLTPTEVKAVLVYPAPRIGVMSTAFYSRQKDTIDYTRASSSVPWQATNLSGLHFAGVESAVDWRLSSASQVKVSWTFLAGAQSALHGLESEYVFNYPVNDARAEWRWTPAHSLLVESRLGVVQRYQQTAYPVWDESLARETGRVRPYVQITNLSNTGYDEILNVRMPGRSFAGGVEIAIAHKR